MLDPKKLSSIILAGSRDEAEFIDSTARIVLYYVSPIIFLILYGLVPSPYGKLATSSKWQAWLGPSLPARWAWFLFELPNLAWATVIAYNHLKNHVLLSAAAAANDDNKKFRNDETTLVGNYILFGVFVVHYIRRTLWYPWQMSSKVKPVQLGILLSALAYTTING